MRLLNDVVRHFNSLQWLLGSNQSLTPQSAVTVGDQWHVLGPFTVGTREATWGADPLESIGGFHHLTFNASSNFRSPLAANGTITWSTTYAQLTYLDDNAISVQLQVGFSLLDWTFLQQVYGWAALQWQAWARGYISVDGHEAQLYSLTLDHILELWVDEEHYFGGDFYGLHRAPLLIRLGPGRHTVDVRLVRDVRSMGGITSSPSVDARLLLTPTSKTVRQSSQVLYPDTLNDWEGPLTSIYASVLLSNDNDTDAFISSLEARNNACQAKLVNTIPIRVVPGQSRPIAFQIDCIPGTSAGRSIDLHFGYYIDATTEHHHELFVGVLARPPVPSSEPQILTYLHPGGIVSYAVMRPPPLNCTDSKPLPVIVALHGAGVDADDEQTKHSLDQVAYLCAWTLLPSGVTPWSSNDWHNWGWADVEAALRAIPTWIDKVNWNGPGIDISRWIILGHSNGGQGVWYALTHHPDQIIAAAPISGYSSIQNYVPYTLWQPADAGRTAVVQAQLHNYRHELLLDNAKGIPLFQQHGENDDNVPAYHSRQMFDLVHRSDAYSTYSEIPGMPHWWDGVLTTPSLEQFYREQLALHGISTSLPRMLGNFTVVAANPGDTGSKNGLKILSLITPGQLGRLHVGQHNGTCWIWTQNVQSFEMPHPTLRQCHDMVVDASSIEVPPSRSDGILVFERASPGVWVLRHKMDSDNCPRTARQHGGLESILRTNGPFQIVCHSPGTKSLATQIANNLLQYYSADVEFARLYKHALSARGNVISLIHGTDLPPEAITCTKNCQFSINRHGQMVITKDAETLHSFNIDHNDIVAAAYLRPLPDERVELVFWAVDLPSLAISARLLPLLTGSGHPDFVIATRGMLHRGLEGVFAMGFLDSSWCPASNSFFAKGVKL